MLVVPALLVRFEPQAASQVASSDNRGCEIQGHPSIQAETCGVDRAYHEWGDGLSFVRRRDFSLPKLARPLPRAETSDRGQ